MRIVLGFLRADSGTVTWKDRDATTWPRRVWGYMPEERGLYPRMPVVDQLVYFASLYGEKPAEARRAALGWLERFQIPDYADRRAEELSKGNQQKVQFIAAILHRPEVLLMDEPFTGLDAPAAARLRALLRQRLSAGLALVLVTHHLAEAWELASRVAVLAGGRWALEEPRPGDLAVFLPRYHALADA